jgi:uncharacterized protein YcbX
MQVAELWRYPVKSAAGERVNRVQVGRLGFADDRMQKFDGKLALNCHVIQGCGIRVGDRIELIEDRERM